MATRSAAGEASPKAETDPASSRTPPPEIDAVAPLPTLAVPELETILSVPALTFSELLLPTDSPPLSTSVPACTVTVFELLNGIETVVVPVPTERVKVPELLNVPGTPLGAMLLLKLAAQPASKVLELLSVAPFVTYRKPTW